MTRYQARVAVGAVTLLLLLVVAYSWNANSQARRRNTRLIERLAEDLRVDGANQRMQKFRRVKMEDGKKVWEVTAQQARYFDETNEILVEAPHVSLYLDDGAEVSLRCREARLYLDRTKQNLVRMSLTGDLQIEIGDFSIRTQDAVYERAGNTISSPGLVHITSRGFEAQARGYTVQVADKRLTLNADVQTTVATEAG